MKLGAGSPANANGLRWLGRSSPDRRARVAGWLARFGSVVALAAPTVLTVGTRSDLDSAAREVVTRAASATTHGGADASHEVVLVTSAFDEGSRSVLVPIGAGASPWVVKVSPRVAFNPYSQAEGRTLDALHEALRSGGLDGLVPEIHAAFTYRNLQVSVESHAGRWTLAERVAGDADPGAAQLRSALSALAGLDRATSEAAVWSDDWFAQLIEGPVEDLHRLGAFDPTDLDALMSACRERSAALRDVGFRRTWRHFDLGPWNVMVRDDTPLFVDWEVDGSRAAQPLGPSGCDALYLTKYWLHAVRDDDAHSELDAFEFVASGAGGARGDGPSRRVRVLLVGWAQSGVRSAVVGPSVARGRALHRAASNPSRWRRCRARDRLPPRARPTRVNAVWCVRGGARRFLDQRHRVSPRGTRRPTTRRGARVTAATHPRPSIFLATLRSRRARSARPAFAARSNRSSPG